MVPKVTRVFIAEDSPSTRASLKTLLQRASDMEVIGEAENGEDAVSKAMSLKPDIVLMDIGLPQMSGLEATKKLKDKHPDMKIIMVTANDSDGVIFDAFSSGADGYYLKSNNDQLFQAVRSVVSGAAWLHPAIAGRVLRACVRGAAKLQEHKNHNSVPAQSAKVSEHDSVSRLLALAGEKEAKNELEDADALMDGAVALCEKLGGAQSQELPDLLTIQADMLYTQEKFIKAEKLYLKALDLRHQALGNEHHDVAASLENLANLYDTRSNYAEAEHYYFWSLKIREKLSGPNHPLTNETCTKLAWVYRAQGKTDLAKEMDERVSKN